MADEILYKPTPFPWESPTGPYAYLMDDGPADTTEFELANTRMRVSIYDGEGLAFKTLYRVECLTCSEVIHPRTSSATIRCEDHLKEVHGWRAT